LRPESADWRHHSFATLLADELDKSSRGHPLSNHRIAGDLRGLIPFFRATDRCGRITLSRRRLWTEMTASVARDCYRLGEGAVMRAVRFSIAGLMGVVLIAAIGLAALRSQSQAWAGVLLLSTLAAFCVALVGAFCRRGAARGGWIGFAVFGWGYMCAGFWPSDRWPTLPTESLLEAIAPRFVGVDGPFPRPMGGMGGGMVGKGGGGAGGYATRVRVRSFFQSGHCVLALLAASLGALVGSRLFGAARDEAAGASTGSESVDTARSRKRWIVPLVLAISGVAIAAMIAIAGSMMPPGAWAGWVFLLTWLILGLVALGALIGRGRRREAWLGATLFGAGFMILSFGRAVYVPWPTIPTAALLDTIRHGFADFTNGRHGDPESITAANARIHEALKQHVPMHIVEETPLEDVLKSIGKATAGSDGKGIPIYVDPIGLIEAERTMTSTVREMDLDGVPLAISLRLCVAQLDLAYSVKDGLVFITSRESHDEALVSEPEEPFQVVGHCVLALIAAGIGALAAPLVCGLTGERRLASGGTGAG
jgi:hypothetical protein